MHDRHHATPCIREASGQAHDLQLMRDVQARDRFVQKQPARPLGPDGHPDLRKRTRKVDPLLLAPRQFGDDALRMARETDIGQRGQRDVVDRAPACPADAEADHLEDGEANATWVL